MEENNLFLALKTGLEISVRFSEIFCDNIRKAKNFLGIFKKHSSLGYKARKRPSKIFFVDFLKIFLIEVSLEKN